ncbi:MAG: hypothetical protein M1818_001276 [Claussenomyces sp. TS43310]|nr:MAG: hypothetical protein M1818_001276 [Claussenomyces sp. TS43310]
MGGCNSTERCNDPAPRPISAPVMQTGAGLSEIPPTYGYPPPHVIPPVSPTSTLGRSFSRAMSREQDNLEARRGDLLAMKKKEKGMEEQKVSDMLKEKRLREEEKRRKEEEKAERDRLFKEHKRGRMAKVVAARKKMELQAEMETTWKGIKAEKRQERAEAESRKPKFVPHNPRPAYFPPKKTRAERSTSDWGVAEFKHDFRDVEDVRAWGKKGRWG